MLKNAKLLADNSFLSIYDLPVKSRWLLEVFFIFVFLKFYLFIYLWQCWVFVSVRGLSLVAASGGLLFIAVRGPLTIVASLVAEHRLQTRRLSSCGSRALERRLSSCGTRA